MAAATVDQAAFQQFEREGWEKKAAGYHRFFSEVSGHNIEPLLDAADVKAGTRVLDVGTGPGLLAAAAAKRGAKATGVDLAEEMVNLARRLHPGVVFRQGIADSLPFLDGEFGAVIGNLLLPHLPDPTTGLRELTRVLSSGGRLALSMWGRPAENRFMGIIVDAVAQAAAPPVPGIPSGPPTFRLAEDHELLRLLSETGLTGVEIKTIEFQQQVPDTESLWTAMRDGTVRTASLIVGQPIEVQRRIRSAFDTLAEPYRDDGGLQVPVLFKIASGIKA
ncbi:MAG: class I SAM-dependent methyltransferase [Candidatus Dormibacteraeota bacterium]|nr:class I SAM-dependent methyltransferase [Candidatus Dormibacteraeota bacterium]